MSQSLNNLFNPKSIAVVGVSSDHSKLSSVIFENILSAGFPGNVYPVNPNYNELFGIKCFKKVSKISDEIDLVVIVTKAQTVLDIVKDCAKAKVKNIIIISAGFKDGGAEGKILEDKVLEVAKKAGIRIVGPNCLGIVCPKFNLNASFAVQFPKEGNISFFSQSGAFNTALLDLAEETKLGFNHFVSIGNKSDLNEMDFFKDWLTDKSVKVIGAYVEDFVDGKDFLDLINKSERKPIVLLHSGESDEGSKAAQSHTGSIAGSSVTINTALNQSHVIKVKSLEKLFWNLMAFERCVIPKGNKVAIVTNAGGPAIMLTDMLSEAGLKMAQISEATQTELRKVLPPNSSLHNPVDVLGDSRSERYKLALDVLEKDPNIDSILVVLTPQYITEIEDTAKVLVDKVKFSTKTIIPLFIGGKYVSTGLQRMYDFNIAAFQYAELAVDVLKNLTKYGIMINQHESNKKLHLSLPKHRNEVLNLLQNTSETVKASEELKKLLMQEAGILIPEEKLVKSYGEALDFAKLIGFPVVLKATTKDLVHKTDLKGIFLNIHNEEQLKRDFFDLRRNLQAKTGKIEPEILVQKQIESAVELFIGIQRDGDSDVYKSEGKGFGHLLIFGHGGIYTEVYKDFSQALLPTSKDNLIETVNSTKISKIIEGARTGKKLNLEALVKTLESIQKLILSYPEIESIDFNPVLLTQKECYCVDVKIFLKK